MSAGLHVRRFFEGIDFIVSFIVLVNLYLGSMSGPVPQLVFWVTFVVICISCQILAQMEFWALALWAAQYESHDSSEVSVA